MHSETVTSDSVDESPKRRKKKKIVTNKRSGVTLVSKETCDIVSIRWGNKKVRSIAGKRKWIYTHEIKGCKG